MSGLSFQLPLAWIVRSDGQYALMASLSTTFDPNVMPWLTANICDDTANHRCPAGKLDLSRVRHSPRFRDQFMNGKMALERHAGSARFCVISPAYAIAVR
jgi:hypothetical protein